MSEIAGWIVGTWDIDPTHSDVSFTVRHMMVSKVRGRFGSFSGVITTAAEPSQSTVTAEIDMRSIDTNNAQRDEHVRSADFFEVERYPCMTYAANTLVQQGNDFVLGGELTLKGVTKAVPLRLEINGFGPDAYGGTRAGFSAAGEISRSDFGVDIHMPMDGGGVVVGDKVHVTLEIEAVLRQ
jgi:polyisoprenoid-binding protein YceI